MNPVITGVDGTDTALNAAREAAQLASATGALLVVASAYPGGDVERVTAGSDTFVYSSESAARQVAENAASTLRSEYAPLAVRTEARVGKPEDVLVQLAEETEAHLIVVGNKRVQGPGRVLGSIATHVLHHAPCDVYVAHTHKRH